MKEIIVVKCARRRRHSVRKTCEIFNQHWDSVAVNRLNHLHRVVFITSTNKPVLNGLQVVNLSGVCLCEDDTNVCMTGRVDDVKYQFISLLMKKIAAFLSRLTPNLQFRKPLDGTKRHVDGRIAATARCAK